MRQKGWVRLYLGTTSHPCDSSITLAGALVLACSCQLLIGHTRCGRVYLRMRGAGSPVASITRGAGSLARRRPARAIRHGHSWRGFSSFHSHAQRSYLVKRFGFLLLWKLRCAIAECNTTPTIVLNFFLLRKLLHAIVQSTPHTLLIFFVAENSDVGHGGGLSPPGPAELNG